MTNLMMKMSLRTECIMSGRWTLTATKPLESFNLSL